jgi:hypothetical protein
MRNFRDFSVEDCGGELVHSTLVALEAHAGSPAATLN